MAQKPACRQSGLHCSLGSGLGAWVCVYGITKCICPERMDWGFCARAQKGTCVAGPSAVVLCPLCVGCALTAPVKGSRECCLWAFSGAAVLQLPET